MRGPGAGAWAAPGVVAIIVAAVLAHGVFFASYLVPWEDESGYLVLGAMAVRGEIRLFQDEMLGERLPLPFYVLGASQLVAGPSLLAGRLWSLALGAAAVALVYAVGRELGGPLAGALSALFLATQAMVVAYYATAMYHALCSLLVAAGLYLLFVIRWRVGAMAAFTLLSLTRTNMAVMVPLVLVVLWWQSRDRTERWQLLAVAAAPPLVFFASSAEHLKLLAYVPGLSALVRPLGYESLFALGGDALLSDAGWREAIPWFIRRYLFWCAAGLGLGALAVWTRLRGSGPAWARRPGVRFVIVLLVYTLTWQALILLKYPKSVAAWAASFAPLGALALGCCSAGVLENQALPRYLRHAVAAGLAATFLLSPTFSTHSAMPRPLPASGTTIAALDQVAGQIASAVPVGSRVFLVGMSLPAYLAGVRPYLPQIIHSWTLVPRGEPAVLHRSGLWGRADIEQWLRRDACYALIQESRLDEYRALPAYRELVGLIEARLAQDFSEAAEIRVAPLGTYGVYRRRAAGVGGCP